MDNAGYFSFSFVWEMHVEVSFFLLTFLPGLFFVEGPNGNLLRGGYLNFEFSRSVSQTF
jgi:hypothetical protein